MYGRIFGRFKCSGRDSLGVSRDGEGLEVIGEGCVGLGVLGVAGLGVLERSGLSGKFGSDLRFHTMRRGISHS